METTEIQVAENRLEPLQKNEVLSLYSSASSLVLTPEESEKLIRDFDDEEIEIRPDGHIYLPQTFYRERLNQVLGIGQWALVTKGFREENENGRNKVYLPGILVVRGCFVSEAVGEAELHSDNPNQSMASVWEAAKSDCITRCCKDLSIATQIYKPAFIRQWQEKYAIMVWRDGIKKPQWRKKDAPPFYNEVGKAEKPDSIPGFPKEPYHHPDSSKPWLNEFIRGGNGHTPEFIKAMEDLKEGYTTVADLNKIYKINKDVKAMLDRVQLEAQSGPIPGKWHARLEKCKTKKDVDTLCMTYKEEISQNAALYKLCGITKAKLPEEKTTA